MCTHTVYTEPKPKMHIVCNTQKQINCCLISWRCSAIIYVFNVLISGRAQHTTHTYIIIQIGKINIKCNKQDSSVLLRNGLRTCNAHRKRDTSHQKRSSNRGKTTRYRKLMDRVADVALLLRVDALRRRQQRVNILWVKLLCYQHFCVSFYYIDDTRHFVRVYKSLL